MFIVRSVNWDVLCYNGNGFADGNFFTSFKFGFYTTPADCDDLFGILHWTGRWCWGKYQSGFQLLKVAFLGLVNAGSEKLHHRSVCLL